MNSTDSLQKTRFLQRLRAPALALFLVLAPCSIGFAQAAEPHAASDEFARMLRGDRSRPRLVVVLSIDQFRADYLTRYADAFLDAAAKDADGKDTVGGFKYLMTRGAWFPDARFEHYPLYTGPGHAAILTGGHPYKHGIIGNEWWDAATKSNVYCVADASKKVIGADPKSAAKPMGPKNLRSTTVGDELKLATGGKSKVVSLALKDRAAILMGGHAQDVCIWFDEFNGHWISSTAYCLDGKLPAWVDEINQRDLPKTAIKAMNGEGGWTMSKPAADYLAKNPWRVFVPSTDPLGPYQMMRTFPHKLTPAEPRDRFKAFALTPRANQFVFDTAKRAVEVEKLGQRKGSSDAAESTPPDLLTISLSTNDYAGHAWGPYAPELLDLTVQTDRQIADFLDFLREAVPGGLDSVVFALTADHGVSPVPEDAGKVKSIGNSTDIRLGVEAARVAPEAVTETVSRALEARYGAPAGGSWFSQAADRFLPTGAADGKKSGAFVEGCVYFSDTAIDALVAHGQAKDRREIEAVACEAIGRGVPGVFACYGKQQILHGEAADHELAAHLARGVHPVLSGDLIVIPEQMNLFGSATANAETSHGTPYAYDTHVPVILCGPSIRAGVYLDRVAPTDIAPTLSLLLGIEFPSSCDGHPLKAAME